MARCHPNRNAEKKSSESRSLLFEWVFVKSQQLFTEIPEELHIVNEVAMEQTLWFFQETIEPFQCQLLEYLWSTLNITCLKVDGGTESHPYLHLWHSIFIFVYPLLLLRRANTNKHNISTTFIDNSDNVLTFLWFLLKTK